MSTITTEHREDHTNGIIVLVAIVLILVGYACYQGGQKSVWSFIEDPANRQVVRALISWLP